MEKRKEEGEQAQVRVFSTVQRMSLEYCRAEETLSESKKQKKMKARCRALGKRRWRRAPLQIAQGHQRVTEAPGASAGDCRGSGGDEFHAGQNRTKEKPSCKEKMQRGSQRHRTSVHIISRGGEHSGGHREVQVERHESLRRGVKIKAEKATAPHANWRQKQH